MTSDRLDLRVRRVRCEQSVFVEPRRFVGSADERELPDRSTDRLSIGSVSWGHGSLPTAAFGDTGLNVTRLGFGTALAGPDRPHWTDETADRQLNQVLDAGINFIDTAYDYAEAERRIGASLGSRYGEFILATKCGCTDTLPGLNASTHEWTRDNLFRGLEISLKRLGRDSVDVMQLHNPGVAECEAGGLVDALQEIAPQRAGALHRRLNHAAGSARLPRLGGLRRDADPLLRVGARARGVDHPRGRGRCGASSSAAAWRRASRAADAGRRIAGRSSSAPAWTSCAKPARAARRSCCATR